MKIRTKLIFVSTTLLGLLMLAGCNKPQDSTGSTKADTTIGAEVKDSDVTEKVKTMLLNDGATDGLDITVVTTKGDVRLTGVVDTQAQFDKIDKIVRSIEGVHSVHDELTIKK